MTVTEYHIELYKRVGGDVDHLQRIGTPAEQSTENQRIIVKMERVVADWELVKNGLTTKEYAEIVDSKLKGICANEQIVRQMKALNSFY